MMPEKIDEPPGVLRHPNAPLYLDSHACTQKYGFVGRTGSGKTYAAGVLVEGILRLGNVPVVVFDTVGVWWGLRVKTDGKRPAFPIVVVGGLHGDVELTVDSGKTIAELVVNERLSIVVDVSLLRKNQRLKLAADLAEELFHLQARARRPILAVFEESQKLAPQRAHGLLETRLLGAVEDIVRLGRNYGIGSVLITQRPQSVNKEVLNQVEALFVGQLGGAHERRAIDDWVVQRAANDVGDGGIDLLTTLPSLPVGTMVVYSPQWLNVCTTIEIGQKTTFDASATPELADDTRATTSAALAGTKGLGAALDRVRAALAPPEPDEDDDASPPSAKSNAKDAAEIKKLRARVRELEKAVAELPEPTAFPPEITTAVRDLRITATSVIDQVHKNMLALETAVQRAQDLLPLLSLGRSNGAAKTKLRYDPAVVIDPKPAARADSAVKIKGGMRRILVALAQCPDGLDKRQLAMRARMSPKSGTFDTYLSRCRGSYWIEQLDDRRMGLTGAGRQALGAYEMLPTGAALLDYSCRKLPTGASRMLRSAVTAFPVTLTYAELAHRVGMAAGSGTFSTYLSRLRTLQLIEGPRGKVRAREELIG